MSVRAQLLACVAPTTLPALVAAFAMPEAALLAFGSAAAGGAIAGIAAAVARRACVPDAMRAVRAACGALAIRIGLGLAVIVVALCFVPDRAALVAMVLGVGLAGSALAQALIPARW